MSTLTVSKSTPTIASDMLIVGIYGLAVVVALDLQDGLCSLLGWIAVLLLVTMSGTFL